MARFTRHAVRQIDMLLDFYDRKARPSAKARFAAALLEAIDLMDGGPPNGRPYPSVYRSVAGRGLRWFRVADYWFAYARRNDGPIVTNVMHAAADIPRQVQADRPEPDDVVDL